MKKLLAIILTFALLSCAFIIPVSAVDDAENNWLYLDSFKEKYVDEDGIGAELLCYEELYYCKDNNGDVEWAFVHAQVNMFCPEIVDRYFHGVHVQQANIYVPFEFGYGVYVVKEDRFYDLTEVSYYNQTHDTPKYEYAFDLFKANYKPEKVDKQYEDKFRAWSVNKFGEECLSEGYKYNELYTHYTGGEPDWALVRAEFLFPAPSVETWVHIGGIGGRTIFGPSLGSPFMTGYGVYDVDENTFYGLENLADDYSRFDEVFERVDQTKYEGLIDVLADINIGVPTGDANSDDTLDVLDATEIQKASVDKVSLTKKQTVVADVNSDNRADVLDATAIQKALVAE